MDISLNPVNCKFENTRDEIPNERVDSKRNNSFISFELSFEPGDTLSCSTKNAPTVLKIVRMIATTSRKRSRRFIDDNENENYGGATFNKNYRYPDKGSLNCSDDVEPSQPHYVNTVSLQDPYKAPQRLEGFAMRNSNVKEPHRTRDANFRSRNANVATTRRDVSTVKNCDPDDEKTVKSRSRKKGIHLILKKIALRQTAKEYCRYSTLHGLRYIGDPALAPLEKIFWLISFVMAVISAGYFIKNLYERWIESPIIISISPEPMGFEHFPFPSITICNMNNIQKTEATRITSSHIQVDKLLLEDLCNFSDNSHFEEETFGAADWNYFKRFMINVSQPCTDMIRTCKWHGNETDCEKLFNPTFTDEGLCCNFNAVPRNMLFYNPRDWPEMNETAHPKTIDWNPETGYTHSETFDSFPWRPYGAGQYFGLTLLLDADLNEYYCSSTHSVGFKMYLHNPVETPKIADFAFAISPGRETRIIIKPSIASAQWSILRVPKAKRKCFFTSERKLKYYRTYTQKNCHLECEANHTLKMCKCVQYWMPKSANTTICGKSDDDCATAARREMESNLYDGDAASNQSNITQTCGCWPGCFEMNYGSSISSTKLDARFDLGDNFDLNQPKQFGDGIAIVHLYFVDSQFPNYVKSELFGFIEFLSSTGGLLGLFMGFSFLSVVEIGYFITLHIWCRLYGHYGSHSKSTINVLPVNHSHKAVYPFTQ